MRWLLVLVVFLFLPSAHAGATDINKDGVVDVQDFVVVAQHIGQDFPLADCNTDGRLDVLDAMQIVRAFGQRSSCVVGYSIVPCHARGDRIIVVDQTGVGNFTSIQPALDSALPGDRILVKNGTYYGRIVLKHNGTALAPIALENYPGHVPKIIPRAQNSPAVAYDAVNIFGEWTLFEGFDVSDGWDGVDIYADHVTVRNNSIHNSGDHCDPMASCGQGVLVVSASNVLIEGNIITRNGLTADSPFNVHGIYLSDYYGEGMADITIRQNVISEHGGAAVHAWIATGLYRRILVEQNQLSSNAHEVIFTNVADSVIRDNTMTHGGHPTTNAPYTTVFWLEMVRNISVSRNTITMRTNGSTDLALRLANPSDDAVFSGNTWQVLSNTQWIWKGDVRKDFLSEMGLIENG